MKLAPIAVVVAKRLADNRDIVGWEKSCGIINYSSGCELAPADGHRLDMVVALEQNQGAAMIYVALALPPQQQLPDRLH
jgi:hypothetical protein